ncbi:hypothetical protein BDU57DRAFT_533057 [Ampelomyces quisqualis]|uniref:Rhodopsin domain-containing protein n=1 Tax=Ampelomyces quisqualis TaxID=50730 RepID=A0A6A5QBE7_AMPQU|nr:hypothetical protein BDU57DRAFT_533057 [Ampelomyces quisqualis]
MIFTGQPRNHPDNANLPNINQPGTIIGVTSLAVIAISLRLWVRIRDSLWGWDDFFVLLAGIASILGDTFVCLMPGDGLGLHLWTLKIETMSQYFKHVYITNTSYCCSATFIKLAILFQYLRLFAETAPSTSTAQYRLACRVTYSCIILSSLWGVTFFLLALCSCNPIAKNWNLKLDGTCIGWGSKVPDEFFEMFAGHSASNMVLDLLVLLTPLPFLSMLRIAGKSKAGLITLFTLGIIVCAFSIGRLVSLSMNRAGTVPVLDMPFYTPLIYIFSVLEVNIAIIAASIPIFWPAIHTFATNKIWVVNEIQVQSETMNRGSVPKPCDIYLGDQGPWAKLESKSEYSDQTQELGIVAKSYDHPPTRSHKHKSSTLSSMGCAGGLDTADRCSQESQRNLCRLPSVEIPAGRRTRSSSRSHSRSASRAPGRSDWVAEVSRQNSAATSQSNNIGMVDAIAMQENVKI